MADRINGVIPDDIALEPLAGEELLSVVLGKHHIELVFEHLRLNIEGGYEVSEGESVSITASRENLREGAAVLASLVGRLVAQAEWVPKRGLRLLWGGGSEFTAVVDESGYESFSFNVPGSPGMVVV
ncbi:hypothetical protein [Leptothrix ochracea]|uniref:hypothetical protein n=1 Tax=Leptothrix ochracea TaxID=735331 RepID=UPI0034E20670